MDNNISYIFNLKPLCEIEDSLEELLLFGLENTYIIEESDGKVSIGGTFKNIITHNHFTHIHSFTKLENTLDWEKQWADFAPSFSDGKAHIDIAPFGTLLLAPGEGFGDFSHPTTRMMIDLMKNRVASKNILDIGCGSGILSLAAIKMGASFAEGIDIDPLAVVHAGKNARLNSLEDRVSFSLEQRMQNPQIILMNMILSEQNLVWEKLKCLHTFPLMICTSGILKSQEKEYLTLTKNWNWTLLESFQESEWLSFIFVSNIQ